MLCVSAALSPRFLFPTLVSYCWSAKEGSVSLLVSHTLVSQLSFFETCCFEFKPVQSKGTS